MFLFAVAERSARASSSRREAPHSRRSEVLRHGPSTPALHALEAIYERLEITRADRLLRRAGARLSYAGAVSKSSLSTHRRFLSA